MCLQSGERLEKSPISSLKIFSLTITKSKINTYSKGGTISNTRSTSTSSTTICDKNITSFLYDSRTKSNQKNGKRKLQEMHEQIYFNPLNANPTKRSNTLKKFVNNLPTNCLSVFGSFVGLALKGLKQLFVQTLRLRQFSGLEGGSQTYFL